MGLFREISNRRQVSAGFDEFLFQFRPRQAGGSGAGHKHQVISGRNERLLAAEKFAHPALRAVPAGRIAHRGLGGHDAGACGRPRTIPGRRACPHPQRERAAIEAAALLPHGAKFNASPQALAGAEAHGRRDRRGSDHRQALAALETAGFEDFAAASGGHAGAETDLGGALFAMRTECGLHKL